jgi:predicted MFS family arabinose efflux permease
MGIVMTSFSVATVAGVPIGLFLAAHLSWHAPFIGIAALCGVLAVFAALTMPALTEHLAAGREASVLGGIGQVLADRNHWTAFAFSALLMFAGFTVIPYITIYMQANVGLTAQQVPYLYLVGGAVTLFTARLFGRMTDRYGKVAMFRVLAIAVLLPMFATTLIGRVPFWLAILVSTCFFTFMSGRMIPGMAIISAAADPRLRGTFMTLNASVQSAAMGLAAFLGGLIITRDAQGLVNNYWMAAVLGAVASFLAVALVGRLTLHGAQAPAAAALSGEKNRAISST